MNRKEIFVALGIALLLAIAISPFASSWPDGLERVAEDMGFLSLGEGQPVVKGPVGDYLWPGIRHEGVATALAGGVGTLIVFGLAYGLARIMKRKPG